MDELESKFSSEDKNENKEIENETVQKKDNENNDSVKMDVDSKVTNEVANNKIADKVDNNKNVINAAENDKKSVASILETKNKFTTAISQGIFNVKNKVQSDYYPRVINRWKNVVNGGKKYIAKVRTSSADKLNKFKNLLGSIRSESGKYFY